MDPLCISRQVQIVDKSYREISLYLYPFAKIRYFIFIWLLHFVSNTCYAQNQKSIDSLEYLLLTRVGPARWDPLFNLVFEHIENNFEKALEITNEAVEVSFLTGDSLKIVKSLRLKGQLLGKLDRRDEQLEVFEKVLPISVRNRFRREEAFIIHGLANLFISSGHFDKALHFHYKALLLKKEDGDTSEIASSIHNIGLIYYKITDYQKAAEYFEESLRLRTIIHASQNDISHTLLNLSLCYTEMGNFIEAQKKIDLAYQGCDSNCYKANALGFTQNQGLLDLALKNYESAEHLLLQSYAISMKEKNSRIQFDNLNILAEINLNKGECTTAYRYLKEAERLGGGPNILIKEKLQFYQLIARYYEIINDYKKVAYYQRAYIDLKNSSYNFNFTSRMMGIESFNLQQQHDKELDAQKQIFVLKEKIIENQQTLSRVSISLSAVLMVLVWLLSKKNNEVRKLNKLLDIRIKERTQILEDNMTGLISKNKLKQIQLEKTVCELNQTLASINGLCSLGVRETSDRSVVSFFEEIQSMSISLKNILVRLTTLNAVT
jgi:tetratricopeptide (TPR) repeat protein